MPALHDKHFPGEDGSYREARNALLEAEIALRRQIEEVAAMRRALPPGGAVPTDYAFEEGPRALDAGDAPRAVRLSELFEEGKPSLVLYSFMFAPDAETPCPMCTAFLDSLNGSAPHIAQRVNLGIVAKAPVGKIRDWARGRGWGNLRLLSSGKTAYNADYFAETPAGDQVPPCNVFSKMADGSVRHRYSTEMLYAAADTGQHNRHVDLLWPLWSTFDLTPDGRGERWFPGIAYG